MPFSQSSQISTIVQFLEQSAPASLLDVGVGMGQYGFLARTNLEHLNLFVVEGERGWQRAREEWRVRIDGIEACDIYLTPVHDYVYNTLHIGDAMEVLPTLQADDYELVMAIDILEHLDKPDGLRFLDQLKRVSRGQVLVSTPKDFHEQEVPANPYENHRSHWSEQELIEAGFSTILENEHSWVAVHRK